MGHTNLLINLRFLFDKFITATIEFCQPSTSLHSSLHKKKCLLMYTMLPCVFVYFLILCSILTVRCGVCESVTDFVRNHSFVFISGWPQSGTSLVHQILSFHKSVSSMISSCERIIGTKHCVGFNHEGQWILPGYVRSPFRSGEFCRIDEIHSINASSIVREVRAL